LYKPYYVWQHSISFRNTDFCLYLMRFSGKIRFMVMISILYMNDQSLGWSWWEESGVEKGIFLKGEKSKEIFKYFFCLLNKFLFEYLKIRIWKRVFRWLEPNVDVVIILNKSQKSEVKSLCILTYTVNCMETIFQKLF
jgi:hypothetical protein